MAAQWLAQRQDHPRVESLRFDAIGVTLDRDGRLLRLEHLEAAF
jgi:putative endonuclease